jgi:PAS domain S-box-containing protein
MSSLNRQVSLLYGGLFLLTVIIFVFDLLTPVGVATAVLYLIPLLLTFLSTRERDPVYFCLIATGLIWIDLLLKPPGLSIQYGAFNRALGTLVMWGVALGLILYKRTRQGLVTAEAAREQAVTAKDAAVEARALSDVATLGAVAGQRKAEEETALGTLRLEGIVQSAMDAIVSVDEEHRVVLFNQAAEKMFQCPATEAIGQSLDRFIPARFRDAHKTHIHAFGKAGVTNRRMGALSRISALRSDGEEFPVEAAISKAGIDDHKYFTVILRDISESMHLQDQLRQAERLAEMGTLAAGMAHEIGTPMNVILGRAEQLMRKSQEDTTRKSLGVIVAQVERITKIMNQLLTFARRKTSERRRINLGQTLDDCLEVLQERIRRMHIKIESNYETTLHPVHVLADPDQMSQVFLNLFINAIHAMPEGGTLRILLERTNSHVKAVVADTGHGIPREDLPKIFAPFFTTKEVGQGTGLGLTVVHGIIQEHGGSIEVESEPGQGTTFTVTLPAAKS